VDGETIDLGPGFDGRYSWPLARQFRAFKDYLKGGGARPEVPDSDVSVDLFAPRHNLAWSGSPSTVADEDRKPFYREVGGFGTCLVSASD